MRHLDLFSGIGGFALAAQWTWGKEHEIISFVEIEEYPQKVLKKNFPGVPIHDDIKTFKGEKLRGTVDILTGGFPCQPYSVAGKQKGAADDRNLWPEMFRIIQETRPTWVIGENVANIINFVEFRDLLVDLDGAKYEVETIIVPAAGIGANHRRDRLWILANNADIPIGDKRPLKEILRKEQSPKPTRVCNDGADTEDVRRKQPRNTRKRRTGFKNNSCDASNTDRERLQKQRIGISDESKQLSPELRGWWKTEPDVGRVANGIPNRVDRIRSLGNAIVPQVVYEIMRAIKYIDENYKQAV